MSLIRFNLDLAIPSKVFDSIPLAKKTAFRDAIKAIKALAVKINEGQVNEEMTIVAQWHTCRHDEGGSCDVPQDI